MTTLILPPRYSDDSISLWRAAGARGWKTERLRGWRVTDPPEGEVVLYGEPLFAATVASQLGYALLEPPFDWLVRVPRPLVRREVRFQRLGEVAALPFPRFVKPADDKCFPARVYQAAAELPGLADLPPETPTLAADPVVWARELRAFLLDGEPVSIGAYLRAGELDLSADEGELGEAADFVRQAAPLLDLPPALVLDVGRLGDGRWAIVEANPCWGSGIYGCDPDRVLDVLARACRREEELDAADERWVARRESLDGEDGGR